MELEVMISLLSKHTDAPWRRDVQFRLRIIEDAILLCRLGGPEVSVSLSSLSALKDR